MPLGQTSGIRAVEDRNEVQVDTASKGHARWINEFFSAKHKARLDQIVKVQDKLCATIKTSRFQQELADAFALRRDLRYATRSRKWLYARAVQSKLDQAFEAWSAYVSQNQQTPLSTLTVTDVDKLLDIPIQDIMARK